MTPAGTFSGVFAARDFARQHFPPSGTAQKTGRYSAEAVVSGTGKKSVVRVTKTDADSQRRQKEYNGHVAELARLRGVLG